MHIVVLSKLIRSGPLWILLRKGLHGLSSRNYLGKKKFLACNQPFTQALVKSIHNSI